MDEWGKGFEDGIKYAIKNGSLTIHYNIIEGKKVFSGIGGGTKQLPEKFQHRAGLYNCGFGEGLLTGFGKYVDSIDLEEECKKLNIIYTPK